MPPVRLLFERSSEVRAVKRETLAGMVPMRCMVATGVETCEVREHGEIKGVQRACDVEPRNRDLRDTASPVALEARPSTAGGARR
jgi:hypothetical protein